MKIKTTTTKTETTEVEISLPAFTKIKSSYCTSYYYVQDENKTTRIDSYSHSIKSFSQISNVKDAFANGFEYISEEEFIEAYQTLVNELRVEFNQIKLDLVQLQLSVIGTSDNFLIVSKFAFSSARTFSAERSKSSTLIIIDFVCLIFEPNPL